jgi:hypothetical protein
VFAVEETRRAQASADLELQPGLTEAEVEELAAALGAPLPTELRGVLVTPSGSAAPFERDFTGRSLSFGDEESSWRASRSRATASATTGCSTSGPRRHSGGSRLRALVVEVHDEHGFRIWHDNPGTISHAEALAADADLAAFAADLDGWFVFVDLRTAATGDAFS